MNLSGKVLAAIAALSILAGCEGTPEPVRYSAPSAAMSGRVSIPHRSVALRDVSLPAYATDEGISISDASGAITVSPESIWADDPTREVTLRLTNALADLTGRTIASDPWPFEESPDVVVEVRFEKFVAETAGRFVAQGRYYVAHREGEGRDKAISFNIAAPFDPSGGFAALTNARSRAVADLARDIAQRGLR